MISQFDPSPSFFEKTKTCGKLFRQSLHLCKQNRALFKPCFYMGLFNLLTLTLFLMGLLGVMFRLDATLHYLFLLVGVLIFLFPLRAFFRIRFMLVEAYMIHQQLHHTSFSFVQAYRKTTGHGMTSCMFLIVNAVLRFFKKPSAHPASALLTKLLTLDALYEAWDLFSHYLIPVIAIEKMSFFKACKHCRGLFQEVTVGIGGILGIDIVYAVYRFLFRCFAGVLLGIGLLIGLWSLFLHGVFAWDPLFVMLFLLIIFSAFTKPLFDLLKTLYFTSLYEKTNNASATHPS